MSGRRGSGTGRNRAIPPEGARGDAKAQHELSRLNERVSRTQRAVVENTDTIRHLKTRADETWKALDELVQRVTAGFESLDKAIRAMEVRSRQATAEIVARLEAAEESSRRRLQQVGTGVAIRDALKGAAEANEIESEMIEATRELERSRDTAELEIEATRAAYERWSKDRREQLSREVETLGAELLELQDALGEALGELHPREGAPTLGSLDPGELRRSELERRDRLVSEAGAALDQAGLQRLARLRRSLERFVEEKSIEGPRGADPTSLPDGVGIPFVVVQAADSEFSGDAGRGEVYGPECVIHDCAEAPAQRPIPTELAARIDGMCRRLQIDTDSPADADAVVALRYALARLNASEVMTGKDLGMVLAHLEAHPIHWLDT